VFPRALTFSKWNSPQSFQVPTESLENFAVRKLPLERDGKEERGALGPLSRSSPLGQKSFSQGDLSGEESFGEQDVSCFGSTRDSQPGNLPNFRLTVLSLPRPFFLFFEALPFLILPLDRSQVPFAYDPSVRSLSESTQG